MEDLGTLLATHRGPLLSLALFLLTQGINLVKGQQSANNREADNTIRDYLEWLRKQDNEKLLKTLHDHRNQLLMILFGIDELGGVLGSIQKALENNYTDLKEKLNQISQAIHKPVLSPVPLHCRSILGRAMLCREQEMDRLRNSVSDVIVSGQPGVGKSFLLYHYATEIGAQFVISDDADDVLAELHMNCPSVLIVDDAVDRIMLLERLIHNRVVTGMAYRIISVCWTHEEPSLSKVMGSAPIQTVELFTADYMASLVSRDFEARSLKPSNGLIREIRKQADGRPGLAIRLIELIVSSNDMKHLFDGTVHYELLDRAFKDLVAEDPHEILGAFAVGGRGGMRKEDVAERLGRPSRQISKMLQELSTGGIVATISGEIIVTRPGSFRHALIKKEFLTGDAFGDMASYKALYELAPNNKEALHTLIRSVAKGACIDDEWLLDEVREHNDSDLWITLAYLSKIWSERVLQSYQGPIENIANALLRYIPDKAIPKLLDRMVEDGRFAVSHPMCPEQRLNDWIEEFPGEGNGIKRRLILFNSTRQWMESGGDPEIGWRSLSKCVSLSYSSYECDPGSGRTISWSTAIMAIHEINSLIPLWHDFIDIASIFPPPDWKALSSAMHQWIYPQIATVKTDSDVTFVTRKTVKSFIDKLLALENMRGWGLLKWAIENNLQDMPSKNTDFLTCHPPAIHRDPIERRNTERNMWEAAHVLGHKWSQHTTDVILTKLLEFQDERKKWGITYEYYEDVACSTLADLVEDPMKWLEKAYSCHLGAHVLVPFLSRLIKEGHTKSDQWIIELLQLPEYSAAILELVLGLDAVSTTVLEAVTPLLSQHVDWIDLWLLRKRISPVWMSWLTDNAQGELALTVAMRDFRSDKQALLSTSRNQWLDVFCRGIKELKELQPGFFYDIKKLVTTVPEVRMLLMHELLSDGNFIDCINESPYLHLTNSLSQGEKISLIPKFADIKATGFTGIFVGDDPAVYAALLADDGLSSHHLLPLQGSPSCQQWQDKAILALRKGYGVDKIARSVLGTHWSWSGSETSFYQGWVDQFLALKDKGDPELAEVAVCGIDMFTRIVQSASHREHVESVHGIDNDE